MLRNNIIRISSKAFTLVELSIVLLIIGILAGGVMVGQDLIRSSNVTATVAKIEKIKQAVKSFEQQYGGLPGDITDGALGTIPVSNVGFGDGVVATVQEQALFWRHLNESGLFTGNFTGLAADIFTTSISPGSGGVPDSPVGGGLRAVNTLNGLAISLDGYDAASNRNDLAILSPIEAFSIDQKYDDGFGTTGRIRGFDGGSSPLNSCVLANGRYAVSNNITCRMQFLVDGLEVEDGTSATCAGGAPIGSTRQNATEACPYGEVGKVLDECVLTATGPAWINANKRTCEAVSCGNGLKRDEFVDLPCPKGYNSSPTSYIRLTCMPSGYIGITDTCTVQTDQACRFMDMSVGSYAANRTIGCPMARSGYTMQSCDGALWTNVGGSGCSAQLQCAGGINIGAFELVGSLSDCGTNYTLSTIPAGNITRACRLGANGSTAFDVPKTSRCLPIYPSAPCTTGNSVNIGCPTGYEGSNNVLCVSSGNYVDQSDNCRPITCGDEAIGSVKISSNLSCNDREEGYMIEVCTLNTAVTPNRGEWVVHSSNCSSRMCPSRTADQNSGFGTYTNALGFQANTSTASSACTANAAYPNNINTAFYSNSSRCGFDGMWQARNGSCLANACPALSWQNTTDPDVSAYAFNLVFPEVTDYGTSNYYAPEHGSYEVVRAVAPGTAAAPNPRCNQTYGPLFTTTIDFDAVAICSDKGYWIDFCADTSLSFPTRLLTFSNKGSCFGAPAGTSPFINADRSPPSGPANSNCAGGEQMIYYRQDNFGRDVCDGSDSTSPLPRCKSCNISEGYCIY